jgi:hypothetical protein
MKKSLLPINNVLMYLFISILLLSLNTIGQVNPKQTINTKATDSQTVTTPQTSTSPNSESPKTCKLKKKKKKFKLTTVTSHNNPSENDTKLDSIKVIRNKEKGIK